LAVYDFVQGADPSVLYGLQSTPNGVNGYSAYAYTKPSYTSQGLHYTSYRQVSPVSGIIPDAKLHTAFVVFRTDELYETQGVFGYDGTEGNGQSVYRLFISPTGELEFKLRRGIGLEDKSVVLKTEPNFVVPYKYYFACLRYKNNRLVANINESIRLEVNNGSDIDSLFSPNTSDTKGLTLGSVGSVTSGLVDIADAFNLFETEYRSSYGSRFGKQFGTQRFAGKVKKLDYPFSRFESSNVPALVNDYTFGFIGTIAYFGAYNSYFTDTEVRNTYLYLKNLLSSRGITLN
jgi:hypothetical protein